jgi:hypothetical protein
MQLGGAVGLGVIAAVASATAAGPTGGSDAGALRWALLTCVGAFCLPALALVAGGPARDADGAAPRAAGAG